MIHRPTVIIECDRCGDEIEIHLPKAPDELILVSAKTGAVAYTQSNPYPSVFVLNLESALDAKGWQMGNNRTTFCPECIESGEALND